MKKICMVLLTFVVLFGLPARVMAMNEWTVVVYMVNDDKDTTLENANFKNLGYLKSYDPGENHTLLVQLDGMSTGSSDEQKLNYKGGSRLRIEKGKYIDEGTLGEVNMGSPQTLWDCLKWAQEKYPAEHYALVINSHGSGVFTWWGEGSVSSSEPGKVVFNPDRKAGRFVAYDHTDKDALTIFEVAEVLKVFSQRYKNGGKFDLVAFDACMPGSVEVLYQLRDSCDFMVGSAETTPITGFNYDAMARFMSRNSTFSPENFAANIAESLNSSFIGAWKTAQASQLVFAVNQLAMQLLNAMEETSKGFGLKNQSAFGKGTNYWDLYKVGEAFYRENSELNGAGNGAVIKQMGKELMDAVDAAKVTRTGAISITWPEKADYQKYHKFYKALDISRDSKWDDMLDRRELGVK
ncbi:MAG: hypothetical protein KKB51_24375 [Candidatus Riflebacteria bacterium]|nr:hypothetical protein [Candidatus Riflebacteria bacterium]